MNIRKFLNFTLLFLLVFTNLVGVNTPASAMPESPTDPTKVPHYFGPWPNWANSPYTLPDVNVELVGDGNGATAAATVGANGVITAITVTNPGIGYSYADVNITGGGSGASATARVITSGIVTSIQVNESGAGYTSPTIALTGGGGRGTLRQVGNPLIARAFATDYDTPPGELGHVFVIIPTTMPANGYINAIQYFNQAAAGGSPTPSAGSLFHAFILRPTGNPDEYQVLWDSGEQTVPPAVDPVGDIVTIAVPNVNITTGDVIGFYGQGIPVDVDTGSDILVYPATLLPSAGELVTLNGADFPVHSQSRTYSFSANVVDTSAVAPLVRATATAYGGVDAVQIQDSGSGYTMPTVDFDLPDDPAGSVARGHAEYDQASGAITAIIVDDPGSGYVAPPKVVIRDGTQFDPINNGGRGALAFATLKITSIAVDTYGSGYTSSPAVTITDPTGSGAVASATVNAGGVTAVTVTNGGSGYLTQGGIKKFQDGLPVLCDPAAGWDNCTDNNLGQHIPIAVPDTTTFTIANGFAADADYYVIAVVQHREQMSSSLPGGTLLREYVQLETPQNASFSKHVALQTDLPDGTSVPALMPDGSQAYAVDDPHYLGPVIVAQRDRAVRIVFYNLLPTGAEGDLFLPVDSTMMGSGMGPMEMMDPMNDGSVMDMARNPICNEDPKSMMCFKDNRATLHLHGGITPWISDGTPHQWITPANEDTPWPQGVSVSEVPDMGNVPGVPTCSDSRDGCMSFYYTNQQSARLMFYHDHSWGITRLNVYAGEAAGYMITDKTEQKLIDTGIIPADQIPLIIQDRTFVPGPEQLAEQDPTWDSQRWGTEGNLWYHHVYMPAQNPGDPGGMSAYGRWMYGPWFWPPATDAKYGPIANPYYDPSCNLDDPATWQYQTDPYCEPELIPGTPNISAGMEQFNDTPVVNGTAYPTTTLEPKAYRMRILNAANDRFWNLQWYIADPRTGTESEVALKAAELEAAQTDPVVFPTPDTSISPAGPSWIQIGTEGGFLPAPVVVPNQPITWITDPTRFDVGNVDKHSLLLGPAERADVVVDFSRFAGKTLILYNDAPAAFPARVPGYDYYTGGPDLSPAGAPTVLPGYGPNTRTIMQVKIAPSTPAPAYNLSALQAAFRHHADGSGVFESGQHPVIVGQSAYNSAYGTSFASSSWCNAPGSTTNRCDGMLRISEQGGNMFSFNTLRAPTTKTQVRIEPKAIHDEMNAVSFDEFGRMMGNLGVESVPATPGLQNVTLYPYVNPSTELIDATNLPDALNVTPIARGDDGTQIWKFTHNGVDTHPIHFHLFDVQVLNRVTWDNIIKPPDANELGWKDTVRVSPLEDTIVALRPIIPVVPFEVPNSVRDLNPMMPYGSQAMFNNIDANGNPTAPIVNQLVNFGWEYVYHCHILSHEEMDMMRPVSVAVPPISPDGLQYSTTWNGNRGSLVLSWNDNSITETAFLIQRMSATEPWTDLATIPSPLDQPNTHGVRTFTDNNIAPNTVYLYRVVAENTIGYGGAYMSKTAYAESPVLTMANPPAAPSGLAAAVAAGPRVNLTWTDNAAGETGYVVERATGNGAYAVLATVGADVTTYSDTTVAVGSTYNYRVMTVSAQGASGYSNVATATLVPPPAAPSNLSAALQAGPQVQLTFRDNANNETGFIVERATGNGAFAQVGTVGPRAGVGNVTFIDNTVAVGNQYRYRVAAANGSVASAYSNTVSVNVPVPPPPAAPTTLTTALVNGTQVRLTWRDNATNETGFIIERSNGGGFVQVGTAPARAGTGNTTFVDTAVVAGVAYTYRVAASNNGVLSAYSNTSQITIPAAPAAPVNVIVANGPNGIAFIRRIVISWQDVSNNETGFTIQTATNAAFTSNVTNLTVAPNTTTYTQIVLSRNTNFYVRVRANNGTQLFSGWVNANPFPIRTNP